MTRRILQRKMRTTFFATMSGSRCNGPPEIQKAFFLGKSETSLVASFICRKNVNFFFLNARYTLLTVASRALFVLFDLILREIRLLRRSGVAHVCAFFFDLILREIRLLRRSGWHTCYRTCCARPFYSEARSMRS